MKSKTTLTLMEQVVMILVFALSAALCIQVFVYADQTSRYNEARDQAVLLAQNAAEALKRGHASEYERAYGADWQGIQEDDGSAAYYLEVSYTDSGNPYLWTAEVTVCTAEGELLFSLPVAGQKEGVGG